MHFLSMSRQISRFAAHTNMHHTTHFSIKGSRISLVLSVSDYHVHVLQVLLTVLALLCVLCEWLSSFKPLPTLCNAKRTAAFCHPKLHLASTAHTVVPRCKLSDACGASIFQTTASIAAAELLDRCCYSVARGVAVHSHGLSWW